MNKEYEIKNFWRFGELEFSIVHTVNISKGKEIKAKIVKRSVHIVKAPEDLMEKYSSKSCTGTSSKIESFLKKWGFISTPTKTLHMKHLEESSISEAKKKYAEDLTVLYKKELIEFLEKRGLKMRLSLEVEGWGEAYGRTNLFLEDESGNELFLMETSNGSGDTIETLTNED